MGRVRARAVREVSRMREYVNVSRNAWLITRAITRDARCDLIFSSPDFYRRGRVKFANDLQRDFRSKQRRAGASARRFVDFE